MNDRFTVVSSGRQDFCVYREEFPVSEPIVKQSAFLQATGEAKYTQDIGRQAPHLNGVYILNMGKNAQPYAQFQINTPSDLKEQFPEVVGVFTAEDLKEPAGKPEDDVYPRNNLGRGQHGFPGDTLFAQKKVSHILGDKVIGACIFVTTVCISYHFLAHIPCHLWLSEKRLNTVKMLDLHILCIIIQYTYTGLVHWSTSRNGRGQDRSSSTRGSQVDSR